MRLIMIRHPRTEANEQGLVYGRTDALYSETGKATIPTIIEGLNNIKIDHIYSSPLTRTRLLAEEIAINHPELNRGMNEEGSAERSMECIKYDDRIIEMDFGKFENKTVSQLEQEYPGEFQSYRENFNNCVVPGGESYQQVYQRAVEFLEEIYRKHEDETVVMVSHSLVIHASLAYLMEVDLDHAWHFKTEPGTIIDFDWRYEYAMIQGMRNPFLLQKPKH